MHIIFCSTNINEEIDENHNPTKKHLKKHKWLSTRPYKAAYMSLNLMHPKIFMVSVNYFIC